MNFLAQQQAVADVLGLNLSVSAQQTQVKRFINQAQRLIFQAHDWPFLRGSVPLVIQTVTDYTTGTVSTTAASTSVTFSATIATSMVNRYLQTSSSKDWYRVATHTAGTATATLDSPAISAGTGLAYTLRNYYYSTSSLVDRILTIRQTVSPFQLMEMSKTLFEEIKPDPNTTGTPKMFMMAGYDSQSPATPQFILWPNPSAVLNLTIEYLQNTVDLSADADTSVIPDKWRQTVMIKGASAFGFEFLGDDRYPNAMNETMTGIGLMKQEMLPSTNKTRIMRSIDQPLSLRPLPFPENYPIVR